jgi:hypothetical protein
MMNTFRRRFPSEESAATNAIADSAQRTRKRRRSLFSDQGKHRQTLHSGGNSLITTSHWFAVFRHVARPVRRLKIPGDRDLIVPLWNPVVMKGFVTLIVAGGLLAACAGATTDTELPSTTDPELPSESSVTLAPNYGSQRAFAVASPWDDLVWRVKDADCTPVDEAADYRMAREDQVPVIPRWEHLVPANPSWNLNDDQLAAVPDLTPSEADQAATEFASIQTGASTVARRISQEEILRFYAASVMSWADFDAIEQPLRKVANRIGDMATTAVRGGWEGEGGNGIDGFATCALIHLTDLTATGVTLCDPDVYATQADLDPNAFYRSGYWSGLATAYLQVRQLATPEQSAVIESFLETAAACALRFAELELESGNRSGLLWNGFYVGAVAAIAAAAASGDLDSFETGVSLLDQALTEHVSEDGSTPNEIATKNESAFLYENMIAQAAVTAALLAGHNGIGLLDHPGLGRLTDRLIREYEHPGWFAEQTGYQQTRQPNIGHQAWLVHLDHVRDDPRVSSIIQAHGGPWTFRNNSGGWAMSWWIVSSATLPLVAPTTTALGFVEPNPTLGTPCGQHMEPTIDGSTLGGDLVQGWGFIHKHPTGFAEHGCLVVSAADGYPTRSGEHALRFEVRDGDCNSNEGWDDCTTDRSRHELSQYWLPSTEGRDHPQYDGDEYWYGWSEYLPADVLKQGDSITFLGQFNSDNAARFYIEDFASGLGFRFNDRNYEFLAQGILKPNDVVRDRWIDIVMHVIWSTSVDGLIEIYINGDLAETLTGPNMDGATYASFDFGIYNAFISDCRCESMPTQVVYYDDIRRGKTLEEISSSN